MKTLLANELLLGHSVTLHFVDGTEMTFSHHCDNFEGNVIGLSKNKNSCCYTINLDNVIYFYVPEEKAAQRVSY